MSNTRTLHRSFAGGEITPELYGRVDLAKFQTGLALCKNMIVLPHGPATSRAGFQYVAPTKYRPDEANSAARLIPFAYNTEQTYIIEMGHLYLRVHTLAGTTLGPTLSGLGGAKTGLTATAANPVVIGYTGADDFANGDTVYASNFAGMTQLNGRYFRIANLNAAANTFTLVDSVTGLAINGLTWTAGTAGRMETVAEYATSWAASDIALVKYEQSADVMTLSHPDFNTRTLSRTGATTFTLGGLGSGADISAPTGLTATANPAPGATPGLRVHYYRVTAVSASGQESTRSNSASDSQDMLVAGSGIDLSWTAVTDAERYNIYEQVSGVPGLIGQSKNTTFFAEYILPDFTSAYPESDTTLTTADYKPGVVSYFEQRKVFGGSNLEPTAFYMTQIGTEHNINKRIPPLPADRVVGRLAARQVNHIRHFVPLTDLLVLTSGGEWVLRSADGGAITPGTVSARPQSYNGSAHVRPVVTSNSVLYLQAAAKRVMSISYNNDSQAYLSTDVSIMAPHLVEGLTITDLTYSESPDRVMWAVRSDGALLGLTYVPEHEVAAWHQHDTLGDFTSCAVVAESNYYALYVVVQRTLNGQQTQTVERLHDRTFTDLEDWFGVDCGLTYSGAAATTISGLWHLEGEEVAVLADGGVVTGLTVAEGSITLPEAASVVHIGLPFTPVAKLLPIPLEVAGSGIGLAKNVNSAYLRVNKSAGVQAGRSLDNLRTYPARINEPYGSPPSLRNGLVQIEIDGPWDSDCDVYITRDGPLPLTLVSLSLDVEVGE